MKFAIGCLVAGTIVFSSLPAQATEGGRILREKTLMIVNNNASIMKNDTAHWYRVKKVVNEASDETFDSMDRLFINFCARPRTKEEVIDKAVDQSLLYDQRLSDERVEWRLARALSEATRITIFQSSIKNCPTFEE